MERGGLEGVISSLNGSKGGNMGSWRKAKREGKIE